MFMHDLNSDKTKVMLLIHPMLSSASGLKECITDNMGDDFRYLMPDLSGHGDAVKSTYVNAKQEAKEIHDYLVKKDCLDIQLAFCASLGGCVMFELMEYKDITFRHLFFEGVSFFESAPLLFFLSKNIFLGKHRKAVKDPELSVKKMEKLYGKGAAKPMSDRFIAIDEESIVNICHDCSYVHLPKLNEEMQKKCVFAYGDKDPDLKNSRKVLPNKYPVAELKVWEGMGHCERISKDSERYAALLIEYMNK